MKHIKIDNKLINLDKKWCHLKNSQKEKIILKTKSEYNKVIENNEKLNKDKKYKIIDDIYNNYITNELNIWIPFKEYKNKAMSLKV